MSLTAVPDTPNAHWFAVPPLWRWSGLMEDAASAQCCGQPDQAHALYSEALRLAHDALGSATEAANLPTADAQPCVAAWVRSSLCLSEHLVDMGREHEAAQILAQAHAVLIELVVRHPRAHTWHQVAAWHSRTTHDSLVGHWQDHGPDPDIEQAWRRACVSLCAHPSNPAWASPCA